MNLRTQRWAGALLALALLNVGRLIAAEPAKASDWKTIWTGAGPAALRPLARNTAAFPWPDLAAHAWMVVTTDFHELYYTPSSDTNEVAQLCSRLDNLYLFLEARSPTKCKTPIQVYLVPKESGRSECDFASLAVRTSDEGGFASELAAVLHEEARLFNFAYAGKAHPNRWSGEFSCFYFQTRAELERRNADIRKSVNESLPDGPRCPLRDIEKEGKEAADEAFSALYFLETKYGAEKLTKFRAERLALDKVKGGPESSGAVFKKVYAKSFAELDKEWRRFYGWADAPSDAR